MTLSQSSKRTDSKTDEYQQDRAKDLRLGFSVKRHMNEEIVYRDRESQLAAIEATFKAARKPITKHYSKPNVHAVEVLPVLPDFSLWRYPCAQVIFDDDPARKAQSNAEQKEEVNQAMIRGMVDEAGDHFVAYFLPTESTKQLRRSDTETRIPYTEGAAYEYELAREYNWNVKNKTMANYEENYFFVFRKDGVYYNELETRVRLSKRRKLNQSGSFMTGGGALSAPKTRLIVHHRDFTDEELKAQTDRLYMLEHDVEGDDDDDDEEEEEGEEGVANEDEEEADGDDAGEEEQEADADADDAEEKDGEAANAEADEAVGEEAEEQEDDEEEDEEEEEKVIEEPIRSKARANSRVKSRQQVPVDSEEDDEDESPNEEEGPPVSKPASRSKRPPQQPKQQPRRPQPTSSKSKTSQVFSSDNEDDDDESDLSDLSD